MAVVCMNSFVANEFGAPESPVRALWTVMALDTATPRRSALRGVCALVEGFVLVRPSPQWQPAQR